MFVEIFMVGLLAGMSPGPDFFIVMKNSLGYGSRVGVATAIGIALALVVHITYTILGFAYVMQQLPSLFHIIKMAGALYLIWLGYHAIRSAPSKDSEPSITSQSINHNKTLLKGFSEGFLCNVLNPKAALFFLSIFSQFITPNSAKWVHWIYGTEIIFAVGMWFVFLAILISRAKFRVFYYKHSYWFDRLLGGVLIFFAVRIIFTTLNG